MIKTFEKLFARENTSGVPATSAVKARPSAALPRRPDETSKGSIEAISTLGAIAIAIALAAYATTRISVRPRHIESASQSASASIRSDESRAAPSAQLALPTIVRLANDQFPSEPLKLE
jgi:hypothetical protein